jgi:hypothetical protein
MTSVKRPKRTTMLASRSALLGIAGPTGGQDAARASRTEPKPLGRPRPTKGSRKAGNLGDPSVVAVEPIEGSRWEQVQVLCRDGNVRRFARDKKTGKAFYMARTKPSREPDIREGKYKNSSARALIAPVDERPVRVKLSEHGPVTINTQPIHRPDGQEVRAGDLEVGKAYTVSIGPQ